MMDVSKRLIVWVGLPATIVGGISAAWAMMDYLQVRPVLVREFLPLVASVQEVQRNQMLMRWQLLETRRQAQGLSLEEQVEYCAISRALSIRGRGCAGERDGR